MLKTLHLRSWLAIGVSAAAITCGAPAWAQSASGSGTATGGTGVASPTDAGAPAQTGAAPATTTNPMPEGAAGSSSAPSQVRSSAPRSGGRATGGTVIEELVVTAQKREEAIQNVPIAVSAFSNDALKAQRIEGGPQLQLAVPNVSFAKSNFSGYNFQIRGVGTKVVATSADSATGIHENNIPLLSNRLFEAEFYDEERVEVLRGPQGTLYGRNATGGVVNLITAKPVDKFAASLTAEGANYDTFRTKGFINIPLGDKFAVRFAGFGLDRDGFGTNITNGDKVDGRNIYSTRLTASWKPTERLRAYAMWEHFNEDDTRERTGKQLCIQDPGRTSVGGVPVTNALNQGFLGQGCLPGSLYGANALGQPNSLTSLGGIGGVIAGLQTTNANLGKVQNPGLRNIESVADPIYKAHNDLYSFNIEYDLTNHLQLTSLTSFDRDYIFSRQDYNRSVPTVPFNSVVPLAAFSGGVVLPNGTVNDPQVGSANRFTSFDISSANSYQWTQEVRLQSSFTGKFNFNVGGNFLHAKSNNDYYVLSNTLTAAAAINNGLSLATNGQKFIFTPGIIAIDPNQNPTGVGHNYFDSRSPYFLNSYAAFGEVYYNLTDTLKITAGLRYTDDEKRQVLYQTYLFTPGTGFPATPKSKLSFNEVTGRANIDWRPKLPFTNETLLYASYSRGYKGGGFNPPGSGVGSYSPTFQPEFVDAFEVGTKNTLLNGRLVMNLTGFYYDYQGYQVSRIVNRTSINDNLNAKIAGAEIESIWEPIRHLRFNAQIGYLHTEVSQGSIIDALNRTQGDASLTVLKGSSADNCVANTAGLAALLAVQEGLPGTPNVPGVTGSPTALLGVCTGAYAGTPFGLYNYGAGVTTETRNGVGVGLGRPVNLKGNDLPNAPELTAAIGAQYTLALSDDWNAILRSDFYQQTNSYSRVFNSISDRLHPFNTTNFTLSFDNRRAGLNLQLYVKNAFDNQTIVDSYLTDDSSSLFQNIQLLDPRTYGVSLTKSF